MDVAIGLREDERRLETCLGKKGVMIGSCNRFIKISSWRGAAFRHAG